MDSDNDLQLIALLERVAAPALALPTRELAFQSLYDRTCSKMYGLALRVVGNRDWAEDVLQEAYLQVWRSAASYRSTLSPPLAWLGLIVRSRALDLLRRHAAHPSVGGGAEPADAPTDPGDDPAERLWRQEAGGRLHEALLRLAPAERWVLGLAYFRDLTHSEIAHCTGLPLGTVKTWIRRGLEQLRGCMSRFA